MAGSPEEMVEVVKQHFAARLAAAAAKVTGDPTDEFFFDPTTIAMKALEWLKREIGSRELSQKIYEAMPDEMLYQRRDELRVALKLVGAEIERRQH